MLRFISTTSSFHFLYHSPAKPEGATMQDQKLDGRQENKPLAGAAPGSTVPVREPATPVHTRQRNYAYYKEIFNGRPMPFAYLDLDLLDQNIRQVVARAGGKRVRLASKSLRSVAV